MSDPNQLDLGAAIVAELARVPEVFGVRLVLWVTAVVFATVFARATLAAAVRLAWRIGLDRERRLGRFAALLRVTIWIIGALLVVRPVFAKLPVITTLSLALAALLAAIATPGLVQSIVAGLSLALRARHREGDQIEIRGYRGSIRTLGLARTQLRLEDGSVVWLPNSLLDADTVRVERSSGAAPVTVRFEVAPEGRAEIVEAIQRAVTMSPFRRAGSRARVVALSEDESQWSVELQSWATRELDLVRGSLRRTVDEIVARHAATPPSPSTPRSEGAS